MSDTLQNGAARHCLRQVGSVTESPSHYRLDTTHILEVSAAYLAGSSSNCT